MPDKKQKLIPPDPYQCQCLIKDGSFMTFGPRTQHRCKKRPTIVATEKREPEKGAGRGAMSLCDTCCEKMVEKFGKSFATITPIGTYKGVMRRDESEG